MWKCTKRSALLLIAVFICYGIWDYYQADLHTRPDMPPGAFSMSYKNGLRAIMVDTTDQRETRRYFGTPLDVPFYLEKSWSFCRPPTDAEKI